MSEASKLCLTSSRVQGLQEEQNSSHTYFCTEQLQGLWNTCEQRCHQNMFPLNRKSKHLYEVMCL